MRLPTFMLFMLCALVRTDLKDACLALNSGKASHRAGLNSFP